MESLTPSSSAAPPESATAASQSADIESPVAIGWNLKDEENVEGNLELLCNTIWQKMQTLGKERLGEIISVPPLLPEAVKVGNLYMVTMILRTYPHLLLSHLLLSQVDGYSLLHHIVLSRKEKMLTLVEQVGKGKDFFLAGALDKEGNNLLHYAAKAVYKLEEIKVVREQDAEMELSFNWFKKVEKILPPMYQSMRNKRGLKPRKLFWKEHTSLFSKREEYMRKKAESCIFIATLVLTLIFGIAFAPPGGYNQETGIPIFSSTKYFKAFIVFELMGFTSSIISILGFWSVISSQHKYHKRIHMMMRSLKYSMWAFFFAVICTIGAFLSAVSLTFKHHNKRGLFAYIFVPFSILIYVWFCYQTWARRDRLRSCSFKIRKNERFVCWGSF